MANLSIRKLDSNIYEKLRLRATKHGVSMEEEVRQILCQVVSAPEKISEVFHNHFGSKNGIDLEVPNLRKPHKAIGFN